MKARSDHAARSARPIRRIRPIRLVLVAAALAGLGWAAGPVLPASGEGDPRPGALADNDAKLADLRAQIAAGQQMLDELAGQEEDIRRGYDQVVEAIALSQQLLGKMEQRERTLIEQSGLLEQDLDTSQEIHAARRRALALSLRAMYLHDQGSDLQMILTAGSFSELVARVRMERMLARLQAGLVERTREQARGIQSGRKQLDSALAEIWRTREEMGQENGRLELLMAEQTAALRELKAERKDVGKNLQELTDNTRKLDNVLAGLEKDRARTSPNGPAAPSTLAALAGRLEWPVRGKLVRGYGSSVHPRFKTATLNNGFNIAAPVGAPVAAVAAGTAAFCNKLPGYGRCVIVDHGAGYYSLYAHLDRALVAAGARVDRGQVIAEVGRPSPGEEPQLYFEIRQGRTPLDPGDWLLPR